MSCWDNESRIESNLQSCFRLASYHLRPSRRDGYRQHENYCQIVTGGDWACFWNTLWHLCDKKSFSLQEQMRALSSIAADFFYHRRSRRRSRRVMTTFAINHRTKLNRNILPNHCVFVLIHLTEFTFFLDSYLPGEGDNLEGEGERE